MRLIASSISRTAKETIGQKPFAAGVLAVFDRACDLVTPGGDVIAVVTAQLGDGPLNVVVGAGSSVLGTVERDAAIRLDADTLQIGNLEVALEEAAVWEPCPDWSALRARLQAIMTSLPALRAIAARNAPGDSLLAAVGEAGCEELSATSQQQAAIVWSEATKLRSAWKGDESRLWEVAERLAGVGMGLTPAGDDFLAGVMLWAWLDHPAPGRLCHVLAEAAVPHTTTLSAAFLRAAARGECDTSWHRLLVTLASGSAVQLAPAVQQVMAHGATSGADTLAGFLWIAGG